MPQLVHFPLFSCSIHDHAADGGRLLPLESGLRVSLQGTCAGMQACKHTRVVFARLHKISPVEFGKKLRCIQLWATRVRCAKWCNSSGLVFGLLFDECCRCFLNVPCLCVSFHHWMSMLACRGRTAGLQALPAGAAGEKSRLGPATGDGLAHAKCVLQRGTNRTTHRRPERDHGVAIQTQQF